MTYDPNYRPKQHVYTTDSYGKWSEPKSDAILVVTRKFYNKDGSITPQSWFYQDECEDFSVGGGCISIRIHDKNGRHKIISYPLTEVISIQQHEPSAAYFFARDMYYRQEHGMTYEEFVSLQQQMNKAAAEEQVRHSLAKRLGIPPENVSVEDIRDILNLDIEDENE